MLNKFLTYRLAVELYKAVKALGLKGEVRDQLERASLSIVCNLAEGSGKTKTADRRKFFEIAMGSLRESQALLEIVDNVDLQKKADQLGAYLWNLLKSLK